jgi:transcriptional regulator EpsA
LKNSTGVARIIARTSCRAPGVCADPHSWRTAFGETTMAVPGQDEFYNRLMAVMVECTGVQTPEEFSRMIKGTFQHALPHEIMVCGVGGVSREGNNIHKMLNFGYPLEYFEPMRESSGRLDSPLTKIWRETQQPVLFQSGRDDAQYPQEWVKLFNQYDLRNTIAHGVLDLARTFSSYFIISRLPGELGQQHAFIMQILIPHLHLALARSLTTVDEYKGNLTTRKRLSKRQKEVLYWMHEGKTNWEIAKILNLSELNVKYHVYQVFIKLEVRSRAHAVSKARDLGLFLPPVV